MPHIPLLVLLILNTRGLIYDHIALLVLLNFELKGCGGAAQAAAPLLVLLILNVPAGTSVSAGYS